MADSTEIYAMPDVQTAIEQAIATACDRIRANAETDVEMFATARRMPPLESPIEAIFEQWFWILRSVDSNFARQLTLDRQVEVETGDGTRYRLDFAVRAMDPDRDLKIAIEVDGHDWHERTREQVIDRNRRDRRLSCGGWRIFHFSGAEILQDAARCVDEVFTYATLLLLDEVAK
jgi:very-short-patch-repair endonuclease